MALDGLNFLNEEGLTGGGLGLSPQIVKPVIGRDDLDTSELEGVDLSAPVQTGSSTPIRDFFRAGQLGFAETERRDAETAQRRFDFLQDVALQAAHLEPDKRKQFLDLALPQAEAEVPGSSALVTFMANNPDRLKVMLKDIESDPQIQQTINAAMVADPTGKIALDILTKLAVGRQRGKPSDLAIRTDPSTGDILAISKTDLSQATVRKGTRQKEILDKNVRKFEGELGDRGITSMTQNLGELFDFMEEIDIVNEQGEFIKGADIPGFGATAKAPGSTLTEEGRRMRTIMAKIFNITLKDRSGAAVTIPEFERLKTEFAQGNFVQFDEDFFKAIKALRQATDNEKRSLVAGHPTEAVNEFIKRGGGKTLKGLHFPGEIITRGNKKFRVIKINEAGRIEIEEVK